MTIRHKKFGPEQLLEAPRRTPGFPSPNGKKFVFTQSVYSFNSHNKTSEVVVFTFSSGEQTVISKDPDASEPKWLGDNQLVWLRSGDNGNTSLIVAEADASGKSYTAGTIAGPVSNLKLYHIEDGMVALAVAGKANPDGSLHNPKDEQKIQSTAKLYDAAFVRHWDHYVTKERNSIFTALLKRAPARVQGREGRFNLTGLTNALKSTGLECPIPPFGGTDHFDIGREGLIVVAKDPDLNPATHTKCNAYYIRKEDLMDMAEPRPRKIEIDGVEGAATSPVFAPNGNWAFLQMRKDGYESDKNLLIEVIKHPIDDGSSTTAREFSTRVLGPFTAGIQESKFWDLSPSSIIWSPDNEFIYAQAEDAGAGCLFAVPFLADGDSEVRKLTHENYIVEALPVPMSPFLLLSSTSLVDNSLYSLLNPYAFDEPPARSYTNTQYQIGGQITIYSQVSCMHNQFGLSPTQVSSIWFPASHPTKANPKVHALMVRPSTFDPNKRYPLAYLIHGGPQGAWNDQWSTRWNPAIFAEQGYVVVCPNPTGSTGYGQPFIDAITESWGGAPYEDLVKGIEYIDANLKFVDLDRAVALGASYGGYMMNWIQGHPLAKKFKALVCHDGVFSMTSQLASEEQYFPMHDMGGPIWEKQEIYDKWDPARFTKHWNTPMLVIHNELDYRLTIAEGLAAFNVLQGKGIESRFLTFSDEGHWVLREENALVWELVVLNWCNKFVGLPEVRDRNGRNGNEFCRQDRRRLPSEK